MASLSRSIRAASRLVVRAAHARRHLVATALRRDGSFNKDASELGVGELQGAKFRIEPLRRVGEDDNTKRARLVYQSRKRGTLESDLLMSTFAATHLPTMSSELLDQYDRLLDENDWDLYYWATQNEDLSTTNPSVAEQMQPPRAPASGEWAQTVGNFKPAYRPVPSRWKDSEILELLRAHVRSRSVDGTEGKGMGFMPPLGSRQ